LTKISIENYALLGYNAASCGNYQYHYSLDNKPEECSSQLLDSGSLKSLKISVVFHQLLICYNMKENVGTVGPWSSGMYAGRGGQDYPGIWRSEGNSMV
jgi:hypothetical protein